jgi:hypothetical protein
LPPALTAAAARWPGPLAVAGCAIAAAAAVAVDALYSAQEGYLSRAPDYDGVSYLGTARSVAHEVVSLHLRTALHDIASSVAPLWVALMALHQLLLGDGTWEAFTARFWAVALLLLLVYWIVTSRAGVTAGVVAVALTALLPVASSAVRASSFEFFTGRADYGEIWSMEDLRPDFFAIVMVLCSIMPLAEHHAGPRRSTYVVSGLFAAAAVLAKPSTAPFSLLAWGLTVGALWLRSGRSPQITRLSGLGAIVLAVALAPWAVKGGVSDTINRYYQVAVTYHATYNLGLGLVDSVTYYLLRVPVQLGVVEFVFVLAGLVVVVAGLIRRSLSAAEAIYAGVFLFFYVAFTVIANKNSLVGFWISLPLWIFFIAGAARLIHARWSGRTAAARPYMLGATAAYAIAVYSLGAIALATWPANERRSNVQLLTVTVQVAAEMRRHIDSTQCFAYAPGPGWPAALEYMMVDTEGRSPRSTAVDIDPSTSVDDYVKAAGKCPAVLAYREDITTVAEQFIAYPVRQPYLRAVAEWVRSPQSGYALDRSWTFNDLASNGPHTLGHYEGLSLTVDLYIRKQGP